MLETRSLSDQAAIRRRRQCSSCELRFTTHETVAERVVEKRGGTVEPFRVEKIRTGVELATKKLGLSEEAIGALVDEIVAALPPGPKVTSSEVGRTVETRLLQLGPVPYLRFASVFQRFLTLGDFERHVADLRLPAVLMVRKRGGQSIEPFDRMKVRRGIERATRKTRLADKGTVDRITDEAIASLVPDQGLITSLEIGTAILNRLEQEEPLAALRFRSVFEEFRRIEDFERALKRAQTRT